jgi:hypothetical protein
MRSVKDQFYHIETIQALAFLDVLLRDHYEATQLRDHNFFDAIYDYALSIIKPALPDQIMRMPLMNEPSVKFSVNF